ncbi:MAG: biotin-dependent carboxyltransferase [Marinospirillum sp.]|uniref:5-oxoprolinase subunit C family protein n=1 Tax=Marinospirillum sp. TaxID=2183934 RepID=UPI0019F4E882|nr:biotin-dependent carboxyltransferase family protein [Marinospirillum sp.]MBE0505195.1 biotin-dependent carboxyltransferase [Marinospirillum sp.]
MSFTGVRVLKGGVLTLVEDAGRWGVSHLGLTQGGVMDRHAWAWGNRLLDNPWGTAALEITLGGLQLEFLQSTWCALTGADMQAQVDGLPQGNWQSFYVQAGSRLELGFARTGMRAYLAVAGGWQTPVGLGGSRSSVQREMLGGQDGLGSALQAGDLLPLQGIAAHTLHRRAVPDDWLPDYSLPLTLGVIEGYQAEQLGAAFRKAFYQTDWRLTAASSRMASLFEPDDELPELLRQATSPLVSEALVAGSIQLLPSGLPVVVMAERQTLGGYPKIGAVCPMDLDQLAQQVPGSCICFKPVDPMDAGRREKAFLQFFRSG